MLCSLCGETRAAEDFSTRQRKRASAERKCTACTTSPAQPDRADRKRDRDAPPEAVAAGGLILVIRWQEPDGAPATTASQLATGVRKLIEALKRRANRKKGSCLASGVVLSTMMISPGRSGGPSEGVVQLNGDELTELVARKLNGGSLNGQEVFASCRAVGQSSSSSETPALEQVQKPRPAPKRETSEETDPDMPEMVSARSGQDGSATQGPAVGHAGKGQMLQLQPKK